MAVRQHVGCRRRYELFMDCGIVCLPMPPILPHAIQLCRLLLSCYISLCKLTPYMAALYSPTKPEYRRWRLQGVHSSVAQVQRPHSLLRQGPDLGTSLLAHRTAEGSKFALLSTLCAHVHILKPLVTRPIVLRHPSELAPIPVTKRHQSWLGKCGS